VGGEQPRIDHVCLGLDEFDADIVKRKLDAEGLCVVKRQPRARPALVAFFAGSAPDT